MLERRVGGSASLVDLSDPLLAAGSGVSDACTGE